MSHCSIINDNKKCNRDYLNESRPKAYANSVVKQIASIKNNFFEHACIAYPRCKFQNQDDMSHEILKIL